MTKTAEPKDGKALAEVAGKIYSGIIAVFICIILGIFPLYHHDYYFDILTGGVLCKDCKNTIRKRCVAD